LRAGKTETAVAEYRQLLKQKPGDLELNLGYANALGLTGDTKQAADIYQQVQAKSGQDPRPWLHYAALMAQEGRAQDAQSAYREAINRDKNNPYALNNLAYLMARQRNDLETALSYAQQAKRTMPDSATINDTLAYVYLLLGMSRNAAAVIEETMPTLDANQRKLAHSMLQRLRKGDTAPVLAEVERGALRTGRL
jgi:Flp pilus assembly protein TadD